MMRAAHYFEQGAAREVLRLGELPTPEPGPGEVRVRLRTSGVNPSDWKLRRGGFGGAVVASLTIPHNDGAGDIDAVGPGVPNRIGERVWVWNGQWKRPHGTAAEYIVLPSAQAVHLPPNVSYAEGACLGIPALAAVQAVRLAHIGPCSKVLISGGAGSVANYAIQLAKLRDAIVISTVSSEVKAAHAKQAGADAIINYRSEDVGERVKALTCGHGIDAVIEVDLSGNAGLYPAVLRPHAIVVVYGTSAGEAVLPALWMVQKSIALRLLLVHDMNAAERTAGIAELGQWLKEGRLGHTIGLRLPLERIAEAHEIAERGDLLGNVVLDIS
jgi:NADPH2:quinone reductase